MERWIGIWGTAPLKNVLIHARGILPRSISIINEAFDNTGSSPDRGARRSPPWKGLEKPRNKLGSDELTTSGLSRLVLSHHKRSRF
jgi:hypothetical protein